MEQSDFETIRLFRGRMEVLLPQGFQDMPDYIAKKKYPSKFRPSVIMMNKDTTVNYLFNLTEAFLPKYEIKNAAKGLYDNLKRTQSAGQFGEIETIDRPDGQAACFFYETRVVDADLFQMAFVTDINGKMMYGGFNCLLDNKDFWIDNAIYSIRSIRETGGQQL